MPPPKVPKPMWDVNSANQEAHNELMLKNLNHAGNEMLKKFPGIGPMAADRIHAYRYNVFAYKNFIKSDRVLIDPPGLGRTGGHYFHTWCTSVRHENKNSLQR